MKAEVVHLRKQKDQYGDHERLKMELVQVKQENERLKEDLTNTRQKCSGEYKEELIREIKKRDEYIRSSEKHYKGTIEALKSKLSSELAGKISECSELTTRLRSTEVETVRHQTQLDGMRERYSQEAKGLLSKMKFLVQERNRLLITNAEQSRLIDQMMIDKENRQKDENHTVQLGHLKKNLNNIRRYE